MSVKAKYTVAESNVDLIKLMARKALSATYTKMIVDHLNITTPDNFKRICTEISTVQRLAGISNSKSKKNSDKGIAVVGTNGQKSDKESKGGKGGIIKVCNFCHKKGHTSNTCWKQFLNQLPQWIQDKTKC